MRERIARPTDPYSHLWAEYWQQNPGLHRSLGAAGAGEGEGEGEGEGGSGEGGQGEGGEGAPDPKELSKQLETMQQELERYKAKHAEAERHRKEQERAAREAAEEAARKSGDVESLEKSWQEKVEAEKTRTGELEQTIQQLTVGNTATQVAAEIFGENAELMLPHVQSRLGFEMAGSDARVRVLDADGKPTAATLDELKEEFRSSKRFAPFVVGTRASGAGGHGGQGEGGKGEKTITRAEFEQLNAAQRAQKAKDGYRIVDE